MEVNPIESRGKFNFPRVIPSLKVSERILRDKSPIQPFLMCDTWFVPPSLNPYDLSISRQNSNWCMTPYACYSFLLPLFASGPPPPNFWGKYVGEERRGEEERRRQKKGWMFHCQLTLVLNKQETRLLDTKHVLFSESAERTPCPNNKALQIELSYGPFPFLKLIYIPFRVFCRTPTIQLQHYLKRVIGTRMVYARHAVMWPNQMHRS